MDYYTILGLRSDASEEEIKKSFRRLALKFHPDRHANSSHESQEQFSVRFKQISEAYEVLSDHKRRALYNREGRAGLRSNQRQGYSAAGGGYRSAYAYGKYYQHGGGSSGGSAGFYEGRGRWPSPLKSFTRMDFVFHAILAGVTIMGFIFVDSFGDAIWKRRNSGKSFEDMIEAADQSKHEKAFATSEGGPPQV